MSGSVGATTYTRDGRARRRSNPQNTVTTRKTEVQGNLAQLAVEFRTLSDSERSAWVGAITRINTLGASVTLSPIAAFCAVNAALMACGEPGVTTPPAFDPSTMIALNGAVVQITDGTPEDVVFAVNLTNSSGASRKVLIEATPPLSPGINNFINRLRQIGCFTKTSGTANVPLADAYSAVFGEAWNSSDSFGKRFGFRVRDLNGGNPILVGVCSKLGEEVL